MTTRRQFIRQSILSSCALACAPAAGAAAAPGQPPRWPVAVFEKVFEGLSYDELAAAIDEIGADGVEATIRPRGHIEPAAAADEVPRMAEALKRRGKRIMIAATAIRRADEPGSESLLKVLKAAGITHYRMGYYHVTFDQPLKKQLAECAAQARELAALNQEIGIQGLYQNHAGSTTKRGYLGALGWDAAFLLDGIDPTALGLAFDTRHLCKDTGSSWRTAVAVCKPHIRSIYVKDGIWFGPRGDQFKDVPLDTGFVNETVFDTIRAGLPPMPLCIHMEWLGYRVFEKHEIPAAIKAHQRDLAALRRWLA